MAEEKKGFNLQSLNFNFSAVDDTQVEAMEKREAELREKERRAELESNYIKSSGVPKRYFSESLETYRPTNEENKKVFEWIYKFVEKVEQKENTKNLVYLSGKFGTGKTHIGCGIVRRLGGFIITSLELCITYDSCRDFKATETRIQYLKKLCGASVLVIDEIGKGVAGIEKEIMPFIVNEFYGSGKLLIFLGNENKEQFNKIIGEAGADRFAEAGIYFSLIGESNRQKK